MNLRDYFDQKRGFGVLSTADASGSVDTAVYSSPHVMDDGTVAFIMADRKHHENLKSNGHAAYLFKEEGPSYHGLRLYLRKVGEEKNTDRLRSLLRRKEPAEASNGKDHDRFLVFFRVDKMLGLTGSGACPVGPAHP